MTDILRTLPTMSWINTANNTFKPTITLSRQPKEEEKKGLRGRLPAFQPGNDMWWKENIPENKKKCLQIDELREAKLEKLKKTTPSWAWPTELDTDTPSGNSSSGETWTNFPIPPIPESYFGGVGIGYHETGGDMLQFNENEGKIEYKEWKASIVFNDEQLAQSLRANRYDLFKWVRDSVDGGIWIRFEETFDGYYQNKIVVKTTRKKKFDKVVSFLQKMRDEQIPYREKSPHFTLDSLKDLDTIE